jgi:hypothetical protein
VDVLFSIAGLLLDAGAAVRLHAVCGCDTCLQRCSEPVQGPNVPATDEEYVLDLLDDLERDRVVLSAVAAGLMKLSAEAVHSVAATAASTSDALAKLVSTVQLLLATEACLSG